MADTFMVSTVEELMALDWTQFEPHYTALEKTGLTKETISDWLKSWTAGARFAFDADTLLAAVDLIESTILTLERSY